MCWTYCITFILGGVENINSGHGHRNVQITRSCLHGTERQTHLQIK